MTISVIDSHTAGEPTRVVVEGFPSLQGETMGKRRADFDAQWSHLRRGILCEPRGSDVLVGALLTPPVSPDATRGVIFFNNVGSLGMCGHGTIGVVETLSFLGQVQPGTVRLDTPVGPVEALLAEDGTVDVQNVRSYRTEHGVSVTLSDGSVVVGDIAYGGNWFFLVESPRYDVSPENIPELTRTAWDVRRALEEQEWRGAAGEAIDHIELFAGAGITSEADSRSFVLCPGGAFDRSPCGTGTSAKLACLVADGKLSEGQRWVQESVTGGRFVAWAEQVDGGVVPTIQGRAYVTSRAELQFDEADPYRWGLPL